MCGFLITNHQIKVKNYKNLLTHRGPDQFGFYDGDYLKILFNRLSIIDLNKRSNQPFKFKNFIIVFNGEIYNYLELKKELKNIGYKFKTSSDTEVLLYSYLNWGKKCLQKFEGMFAFAIYDTQSKKIFIARDRFGIKPLFYNVNESKFIISSEKKALFELGIKKKLNNESIKNFLIYGVYQNDCNTFYENIYALEPGHYLEISKKKIIKSKWFDFTPKFVKNLKFNDAKKELNFLMNRAMNYCLRSDKNISVAVSGGVDSSAMIYKLIENKNPIVNSLVHWSCDDENDEQDFAKKLAKKLNKKILISHFKKKDFYNYLEKCMSFTEEPFGGLAVMSSMKTFENLKKKGVRVLLDGNGIDEILGGYTHHINAFKTKNLNYNVQPVQGLKINFPLVIFKNKKDLSKTKKFKIKKIFNDPLKDSMYNDLFGSKLRRALLQQDHVSMAYSVESRFPWLNNELVNFCFGLPNNFLIKKNVGKFILRDSIKEKLMQLPKRGAQSPQTKWMKEFIISKLIKDLNSDSTFFDVNIFDKNNLLKELNIWLRSNSNNSVFPWYFLMSYIFIKKNILD
mgnify:CR=1 FL=1|tara:strand:- start:1633 stop:3333 length:1701 start_codon:yes stop_codon:yes gene_type:complete